MLYQTSPDPDDGHVHQAELDDQGNGISDTNGAFPHVHEVVVGEVQSYSYGNFSSTHPGKMAPLEGPSGPPPVQQQDMNLQQSGPTQEAVRAAVDCIMDGHDPHDVAGILLFG